MLISDMIDLCYKLNINYSQYNQFYATSEKLEFPLVLRFQNSTPKNELMHNNVPDIPYDLY